MQDLYSGIVYFLFIFTPLANAVKIILLIKHKFSRGHILYTLIYVAYRELFSSSYISDWYNKLGPPSKDSHTIRSTAMIEEVCRWIETCACSEKSFVRYSKSVHLKNTEDMKDQFDVFHIDL